MRFKFYMAFYKVVPLNRAFFIKFETPVRCSSLKLKSFFVWYEVKLKVNAPDKLLPELVRGFKDASALVNWLRSVKEEPQPE